VIYVLDLHLSKKYGTIYGGGVAERLARHIGKVGNMVGVYAVFVKYEPLRAGSIPGTARHLYFGFRTGGKNENYCNIGFA
jgi:hypothetical protein